MSDKLNFEDWWNDFSHKFRNDKDGGYGKRDRLILEVKSFTQQKRIAFIDELLHRKNLDAYACELIPLFGNHHHRNEIKKRAIKRVRKSKSDLILTYYFDMLIRTYEPDDLYLLTDYYLNYQDRIVFRIPTELFEIDKDLFLHAFTKYFPNYSTYRICIHHIIINLLYCL